MEEPNCVTENEDKIFASFRAGHTALEVHSTWQPADETATVGSQTGHYTILLPSIYLEMARLAPLKIQTYIPGNYLSCTQ